MTSRTSLWAFAVLTTVTIASAWPVTGEASATVAGLAAVAASIAATILLRSIVAGIALVVASVTLGYLLSGAFATVYAFGLSVPAAGGIGALLASAAGDGAWTTHGIYVDGADGAVVVVPSLAKLMGYEVTLLIGTALLASLSAVRRPRELAMWACESVAVVAVAIARFSTVCVGFAHTPDALSSTATSSLSMFWAGASGLLALGVGAILVGVTSEWVQQRRKAGLSCVPA